MRLLILVFIQFTLMPHLTKAQLVDTKNANFSLTALDFEVPGSGFRLSVTRTYNSRSLMNGIFGFGWCSEFETKMEKLVDGGLKVTECGDGQETLFYPDLLDKADIKRSVDRIIAAMTKENAVSPSNQKSLRETLERDADKRQEFAKKFKVVEPVKEGLAYRANGSEVDRIVFSKGVYTRTVPDGTMMRFNESGWMTHLFDRNGNNLVFQFEKNGLIRQIRDNNGRTLDFKYTTNNKVRQVSGPNGLSAEYKYENMDDLAWVKNGWKNEYSYKYDELHNLVHINYPDKTHIALTYDTKKDWVSTLIDREKCTETYDYDFSKTKPQLHYWTNIKKVCGKETVNESRHEYVFKEGKNGQAFLERVTTNINGEVTEVTYHENFAKPVSLRRNSSLTTFEYNNDGSLAVRKTPLAQFEYKYDSKHKKVSEVKTSYFGEKGKVTKIQRSEFQYDERGNIRYAANSDGQKIDLTYDQAGRIATIVDQTKKKVVISYDDRFGKPSVITRPGLGTIKMSYKPNSAIDKVESKEGPTVAMQIASTFNSLLDVIAPANADQYN